MKKVFLIITFALITGCGDEPVQENTTWLVLLDMSGMENTVSTRKIYSDNFNKAVKSVQSGDRLIVSIITESSVNEPVLVLDWICEIFKPTTSNELYLEAEKELYKQSQLTIKDSIVQKVKLFLDTSHRITNRTDIIGALHIAENVFKKIDNKFNNLIIFSDMEENSEKYNFPSEHITIKRINQIIENEKSSVQGLPDLNGVTVYIVGAHSKFSEKFYLVRKFWLEFFKASGADLKEANYNSTALSIN